MTLREWWGEVWGKQEPVNAERPIALEVFEKLERLEWQCQNNSDDLAFLDKVRTELQQAKERVKELEGLIVEVTRLTQGEDIDVYTVEGAYALENCYQLADALQHTERGD
jgi:hypothetical protein